MSAPQKVIIVAVADNGVIGTGDDMPWRSGTDFAFFREQTMGRPLVVGRKTFDAIGKPLKGRDMIVITRDRARRIDGVRTVPSFEAALALCTGVERVMIGGGGAIYEQTIPVVDRLLVTRIHASPEGDTYFPEIDRSVWEQTEARFVEPGPRDTHPMTFETWERRE